MRVETVSGLTASCEALGSRRQVSLLLLAADPPGVGDYVMVHLGQAIRKVTQTEAREAWALYAQIMEAMDTPLEAPARDVPASGG